MAWNDENISPSVTQETDAALVALGQRGMVYLNVNYQSIATENFAAIQVIDDTVFDSITATNISATDFNDMLGTDTIPAGTIIYGPFTSVSLLSGRVICYKA